MEKKWVVKAGMRQYLVVDSNEGSIRVFLILIQNSLEGIRENLKKKKRDNCAEKWAIILQQRRVIKK